MSELTRDDVIARLKTYDIHITPHTWSAYVARGQAPEPARRISRTPLWTPEQIDHWATSRPGQGARTDRLVCVGRWKASQYGVDNDGTERWTVEYDPGTDDNELYIRAELDRWISYEEAVELRDKLNADPKSIDIVRARRR